MRYVQPAKPQIRLRAYAQSDQSLCLSLKFSMTVKLLTEHRLECLSIKESGTGSSEPTIVKMPHCWKSCVLAHILNNFEIKSIPFLLSAISPAAVFYLAAAQVYITLRTRTYSTVLYLAGYRSTAVKVQSDQLVQGPAGISGWSGVFSRYPVTVKNMKY